MKRPNRYAVICNKTGAVLKECNCAPSFAELQTWEPTADNAVRVMKQTRTAYVDTRYDAKIRLYNYITYTRAGLPIPKYRPFHGTEIGKSIPILPK